MSAKRKTWRDRPRSTVAITLDAIDSGGTRFLSTQDPHHAGGTKPEAAIRRAVGYLTALFGVEAVEAACAAGIVDGRELAERVKPTGGAA